MENKSHWLDTDWWQKEIADVVSATDPVLCNLRITLAHYKLSRVLHEVTGKDSGANFHTWAVWGSKKAGETIRQEDTRRVRAAIELISAVCGLGLLTAGVTGVTWLNPAAWIVAGFVIGVGPTLLMRWLVGRTQREVLAGNRIVLEDIGQVTARFVARFQDRPALNPEELDQFLLTLRPERTESGGQALLSRAFLHYYQASYEQNLDKKYEQMFLANCYAIRSIGTASHPRQFFLLRRVVIERDSSNDQIEAVQEGILLAQQAKA